MSCVLSAFSLCYNGGMEPSKVTFKNSPQLLQDTIEQFKQFKYKLYGQREIKLYQGDPDEFEFDLNLGMVHFTEQDFQGISAFVAQLNATYGTKMTFCIYPALESNRDMIINVRLPGAPMGAE